MGIRRKVNVTQIVPMKEKTEFNSPLDELIEYQTRSSQEFFGNITKPNGKKESYYQLPKRFSDKLERFPTSVRINVTECMRRLYRNGQDWVKERAFHKLKENGNLYPYEEKVLSKIYSLKEVYESYWLRDMIYRSDLNRSSLIFVIRLVFDTDKITEDDKIIRLNVDVKCDVGADGHVGYSIYDVLPELV